MIIDNYTWEGAYTKIQEQREQYMGKIRGGKLSFDDYHRYVGFLDGLDFFEAMLKETKSPKRRKEEDADNEDAA